MQATHTQETRYDQSGQIRLMQQLSLGKSLEPRHTTPGHRNCVKTVPLGKKNPKTWRDEPPSIENPLLLWSVLSSSLNTLPIRVLLGGVNRSLSNSRGVSSRINPDIRDSVVFSSKKVKLFNDTTQMSLSNSYFANDNLKSHELFSSFVSVGFRL